MANRVNNITSKTIEDMKKKSVLNLPNRPSEKGISAEQVKKYFTDLILGSSISSVAEIQRLCDEINAIVEQLETADTTNASAITNTITTLTNAISTAISNHNSSPSAHGIDTINSTLTSLNTAITNLNNSKVAITDIINNLTSTNTDKPLSANQGKVLKGLIDDLQGAIDDINGILGEEEDSDSLINTLYDLYNFVEGISEHTNLGDVIDSYISSHDNDSSAHTNLFQEVTDRLDDIETIIETIDGESDADTVINKLHEVVALLNGYAEGTTLVNLLSVKADKSELPTKVSDLENDSGFITEEDIPNVDLSNYYDKDEVEGLISSALLGSLGGES